jgi:hypothetical protein
VNNSQLLCSKSFYYPISSLVFFSYFLPPSLNLPFELIFVLLMLIFPYSRHFPQFPLLVLLIYRVCINYRSILQNHIFTNTEQKCTMLLPLERLCLQFHSDLKCIRCAPHV